MKNEKLDYTPYTYPHPLRGSNIALGKTVTSSTGDSAELAVDNNLDTFWTGTNYHKEDWWQVDLGSSYNINQMVLINYFSNNRYYHYHIKGSNDENADWDSLPNLITKDNNLSLIHI